MVTVPATYLPLAPVKRPLRDTDDTKTTEAVGAVDGLCADAEWVETPDAAPGPAATMKPATNKARPELTAGPRFTDW
jgi:hypothetical protein